MSYDNHVRRGHPIIFGLIVLFGIIELAISAWLTARYGKSHFGSDLAVRTRSRFILFTSCWTVFFSLFYAIIFWHSSTGSVLTSIASHGIFLFITWLFWTAGAASLTSALGGGLNCNATFFAFCGQLNAEEAFAWIEWILVTFAILVVLFRGVSSARRGDGYRGQLVDTV